MPASFLKDLDSLEASIGHTFIKKAFIKEALTHRSYSHENQNEKHPDNERLEFLGDAILGAVISDYLFNNYKDYSEARLSKVRSHAVKESTLAEIADKLDIGNHLLLGKGEETSGGRSKPSLLANAFEALLAAIYLDGGMNKARDFVLAAIVPRIADYTDNSLIVDFKTRLQEVTQSRFGTLPVYRVITEKGPEHDKVFEIALLINNETFGKGTGRTKKSAEQMAAEESLRKIEKKQDEPSGQSA